jgi:predicted phage terminase large subunit-like protein
MSSQPPLNITGKDARRELARRELARRHVIDFGAYVNPLYRPSRHHRYVGDLLEQVETYIRSGGKTGIGRLLVFMPPQHGKSELVSKLFSAWLMGRMCGMYQMRCYVITASYNSDRADENSRSVRDILTSAEYANVFGENSSATTPVRLSSDSRSVEEWTLAAPHRGGMKAAGIGGGLTGFPANLEVLDDLFKNREEAESADRRDTVWDWWLSSAYTRLNPGAAVVGMLTRWHGDDWAGRLIKQMATNPAAERWVVVNLPAFYEPPQVPDGKTFEQYQEEQALDGVWVDRDDPLGRAPGVALWPEWYPASWLETKRANLGPYDWSALYQQSPYLKSGSMFKREWFVIQDAYPDAAQIVAQMRYWDKAGTTGGGKYTAGVLIARLAGGMEIVLDVVRGQWSAYEREQTIKRTAEADVKRIGPKVLIWHEQEGGSGGKESAEATNRKLAADGFSAHFNPATSGKEERAEPWSSQAEGDGVRLLRAHWNSAYIEEHVAFPKGRFSDQVDASSGGHARLNDPVQAGWMLAAPQIFLPKPAELQAETVPSEQTV